MMGAVLARTPAVVAVTAALALGACSDHGTGTAVDEAPSQPFFTDEARPDAGQVAEQSLGIWLVDGSGDLERVGRRVVGSDPATAVVLHLFAGPTPAEARRGLRLVTSGFEGVVSVTWIGARVRVDLVGRCDDDADPDEPHIGRLVAATVRELGGVEVVDVRDGDGRSRRSADSVDSFPPCLVRAPPATSPPAEPSPPTTVAG